MLAAMIINYKTHFPPTQIFICFLGISVLSCHVNTYPSITNSRMSLEPGTSFPSNVFTARLVNTISWNNQSSRHVSLDDNAGKSPSFSFQRVWWLKTVHQYFTVNHYWKTSKSSTIIMSPLYLLWPVLFSLNVRGKPITS